ncbi:MAG TPA: glycosyltransferase family 39 protein [Candidatus Deferrimicrobiaceae bacterium]|jgi:hypothetical protein
MSGKKSSLLLVFLGALVVKCVLGYVVPLTTDEAYYRMFGKVVAAGYYDHPPMIGWVMSLALMLGDGPLAVRLPAILMSSAVGAMIYLLLRGRDEERACLVTIFYLLSPLNVLFVIVTTDTPLFFFSFLSAFLFYRALTRGTLQDYLLSGLALGGAFLSKYIAVLLGFGYLAYWCLARKDRPSLPGMLMMGVGLLPAVAQNLWWNHAHDWNNLVFNLFNRNGDAHFGAKTIGTHLLIQVYLMTPPVVSVFLRQGGRWARRVREDRLALFGVLYLSAMAVFLGVSTAQSVGLHWALAFYPFLFVLLFLLPEKEELSRMSKRVALFTALHLVILAVALAIPLQAWEKAPFYQDMVFLLRTDELGKRLAPLERDYRLASTSYGVANILGSHMKCYVFVFGPGSIHGRQDDLWMDFRAINHGNVLVVCKGPQKREDYLPYFDSVALADVSVEGAMFHLVMGRGFRYDRYRDVVLRQVLDRYYAVPGWLPRGRADFANRYFGSDSPPISLTLPVGG